ncbi:hypothetical protein [Desulfopila sp. IMCC35008]|uniref:hypothetical protein n=1 Tax=Desulfopila sp. IMCC35008 TaxID=2653858 RepID=UPI0013D61045|nr:hypothetical protein [Desulfopila sp. IMCC35008]
MDLKKQLQLVHTRKNDQFRKKHLNTRISRPNSFFNEYDILFKEVTFLPNPVIFKPQVATDNHLPNRHQARVKFCRLSNKEFEDCFIVDTT